MASATTKPWVTSNGWRLFRDGARTFAYDAPGDSALLAAAEAFTWQREALIKTDDAGRTAFERIEAFFKTIPDGPSSPLANIGVIDDATPQTGEVMNLLVRHNLLFRIVAKPDPALPVNIRLGSPEFPREGATNPDAFAQKIRHQVTDEKRTLRIYGSDVVIGRLTGDNHRARLQLINYGRQPVHGLRVRVLGTYEKADLKAFGLPGAQLADLASDSGATEFTLPEIRTFALVDLSLP